MTIDIKKFKRNRVSAEEMAKRLDRKPDFGPDERFWKPTPDKTGNSFSIIRFLPGIDPEVEPMVNIIEHSFKNPKTNQWYIETSLATFGLPDPLDPINHELYNSGDEAKRKQASLQKRKKRFIANILVIDDRAKPENNGKVFLFKFGVKIQEMILDKMKPAYPDEVPFIPFDPWDGANFALKTQMKDDFLNYDKSSFYEPEPLFDNDNEIAAVLEKQYDLSEFKDPANFKSFDELKKRLDVVLGLSNPHAQPRVTSQVGRTTEAREPRSAPPRAPQRGVSDEEPETAVDTDVDDDDVAAMMNKWKNAIADDD